MLKTMLTAMKQMSEQGLKERTSFRAMWYGEWSDLFLKAFDPESTVVYTSIYAFPMEILAAFDVAPFDFEIAGSLPSAADMGLPLMERAEGLGYSGDICSFHRASIGGYLQSYFPEPDLLISTSFYCDGKGKTNDILSHLSGRDSFFLSVPHEISRESVSYVEKQLRDAAGKIGEKAGQKLDEDRLREAVRSSNRARRLQLELHEALRARPAALNPQDFIGYSINGQLFNGRETREILEARLIEELAARRSSDKARVEKHRIYWLAWLPVYRSNLFEILKSHGVNVAMCETSSVYWDEMDEDNPFEGLALKCLKNPFIGRTSRRLEGMEEIVRGYEIDGALLFATPACRHSKSAASLIRDEFSHLGIPLLVLDMDISDPRGYLPEQVRTRVEGFIEVMDNRPALLGGK
ncbi:MAG TPA: 2-hydroxyacyl-CoA dehydratase family protein [Deltaproteobacteria bacterium]|jgi:benzoyl-CoA reductase/2-hydroxyglutaryl-CoA dehydratase subunit BcrC/BadD/HgdB|nr:2-hydroxyacyl-CoA dehydratase family protein [Deltaproteobacteria bacterium]HQJ07433.1 2-hydroxyacyl-CoA dehydratase family protein [Deltaproteobacteria bacterium]